MRTTARLRPASAATCRSEGSRASFSPVLRSISASASRPRTHGPTASLRWSSRTPAAVSTSTARWQQPARCSPRSALPASARKLCFEGPCPRTRKLLTLTQKFLGPCAFEDRQRPDLSQLVVAQNIKSTILVPDLHVAIVGPVPLVDSLDDRDVRSIEAKTSRHHRPALIGMAVDWDMHGRAPD